MSNSLVSRHFAISISTLLFSFKALFFAVPLVILCWAVGAEPLTSNRLSIPRENIPPISTNDATGYEDLLARELYKRLGYDVEFHLLPSERIFVNVNKGIDDGFLSRIGGLSKTYPNLVQIEESVVTTDYVAFSRLANVQLAGWQSLKPYTVAIVTGWKILENNIKDVQSLTKVENIEQLFRLLDSGRVDLVVMARMPGLQIIKDHGLKGIRVAEPPLAQRKKYFYLHKKYQDLAVRASAVLREMKADGSHRRIIDSVLKQLLIN